MRPAEIKISLSHNFVHWSGTCFISFRGQHWCFFGWLPWVRWLHSDNMKTLSMWSCKIKVDEVHSAVLICQNLEIPGFGIPPVWPTGRSMLVVFLKYTKRWWRNSYQRPNPYFPTFIYINIPAILICWNCWINFMYIQ